jgi:hypothetical protein
MVQFLAGARDFSLLESAEKGSGVHRASYVMGTRVKWKGNKADHSPPCTAEVKMDGAETPLPHTSSWHDA